MKGISGFIVSIILSVGALGSIHPAYAEECTNIVSISNLRGVLYKPENLHGARGPTLIVQNPIERTGKRRIQIRDLKCNLISSLGLFSTDWPYGARYYSRSGGSKHTAKQLWTRARATSGSSGILIQGVNKWILIKNPLKREGEVFSG